MICRVLHASSFPFLFVGQDSPEGISHADLLTDFTRDFPVSSCAAVISNVLSESLQHDSLNILESCKIFKYPELKVVLLGRADSRERLLAQDVFRNSKHLLFVSPEDDAPEPSSVSLHGRCLFCEAGHAQSVLLDKLKSKNGFALSKNVFPDLPNDFNQHEFNIVALDWYPITALRRLSTDDCSEAALEDSLDGRIITEISKLLNFKFTIRLPCDGQWGTDDGKGNWSGIVGTLQHNKGDFSFLLSLYPSRLIAIDYSRIYTLEPVVFVARKPQPLPRSLALVRPFSGETWISIMISVVVATVTLKLLSKLASFNNGQEKKSTSVDVFFLILSIMLSTPPKILKINTGKMFLCCWWLYCMIVAISYRSSLIAHLTFPSKSVALRFASELVEKKDKWSWGYEPLYGSGWTWFKDSKSPDIQEVFKNFQILELKDQMANVLKGNYAFFTYYFYIKTIVEGEYTNKFGFSPIYFSTEKYLNYGGYGWGFRKGAPFRMKIDKAKHHLLEAGLVDYWLNKLIDVRARQTRKKIEAEIQAGKRKPVPGLDLEGSDDASLFVLSLDHMQGAFYLYIAGCGIAFIFLILECIVGRIQNKSSKNI